MLALKTKYIPMHYGIWDKYNDAIVIQFVPAAGGKFKMEGACPARAQEWLHAACVLLFRRDDCLRALLPPSPCWLRPRWHRQAAAPLPCRSAGQSRGGPGQ